VRSILVVDDEIMNREIVVKILLKEGFRVLEASDGKEALELLQLDNIDLMLLDLMMPVLDGFEVLHALPTLQIDVPVIVFSALGDRETRAKVFELNATEFILKPFNIVDLMGKIRSILKSSA